MLNRISSLLVGLGATLSAVAICAADPPPGPAYQIILRSRRADVTPTRTKHHAQTGGGSIVVEQPEPNTIVVTMTGSAVAGSAVCGSDTNVSSAWVTFDMAQDLDIFPTRPGVRRPRIGMVGRVIGTLQVTDPGKCCKSCGTSEQGPGTANLSVGETTVLSINVPTSSASCGQELVINHRDGPIECPCNAGCYHLTSGFRVGATQGKGVWNRQAAVADFDPSPQFDSVWSDAMKPFRAVPRRDFGFKFVLRVIEDPQCFGQDP